MMRVLKWHLDKNLAIWVCFRELCLGYLKKICLYNETRARGMYLIMIICGPNSLLWIISKTKLKKISYRMYAYYSKNWQKTSMQHVLQLNSTPFKLFVSDEYYKSYKPSRG